MTECPICAGTFLPTNEKYAIGELFDRWASHGAGYPFSRNVLAEYDLAAVTQLHRCSACAFGLFLPSVIGSDLFYQELSRMGESWYYLADKWEYRKAAALIGPAMRVLDVGCGQGFFLEECRRRGAEAEGIELNSTAAAAGRAKGFEVHEEMLEDFANRHVAKFDVVSLFQVLEHVAAPVELAAQAFRCTTPTGRLIIAVPNMDGLVGKVDPVPSNVPPHHLSRWTTRSLQALAARLGASVECFLYEPAYDHLPGFLQERMFAWVPARVKQLAVFRYALVVPSKILRRLRPEGIPSVPGHTVIAVLRKQPVSAAAFVSSPS